MSQTLYNPYTGQPYSQADVDEMDVTVRMLAAIYTAFRNQLASGTSGGGGGTQYTDGASTPANPIGTVIAFDNGGTIVDVASDHPFPISGSFSAATPADLTASGSLTAAQPTPGTVVAGGTVTLALGTGIASWAVDLRGTFSAGTTVLFEGRIDASDWIQVNGVPVGITSDSEVNSVVGGSALQYQGNATGLQAFRVRASTLQASDSVAVVLIGSTAPDGGFLTKALPPGSATIGGVQVVDSGGANKLAIDASGKVGINNLPTNQRVNAQANDFLTGSIVDLATLLTLAGTPTDANTVASLMGRLTKIRDVLISGIVVANTNANGQTVMANSAPVVLASDQIVPVKASFTEILGQGTGVVNAVNTDLIPSTDVSAYKWLSLHTTGTWTGRITYQCSNDNANWGNLVLSSLQSQLTNATSTTVNDIVGGPVQFRYFRARMTTFTSNTSLAGTLELYTTVAQSTVNSVLANQSGTWTEVPNAATTGGATPYHLASAATTNATVVKASAGQIYGGTVSNSNAAARYVKFYNSTAAPTVGTTPIVKTVLVPPGGVVSLVGAVGIAFSTGISIATTVNLADTDATAVGANDLSIDLDYK